MPLITKQNIVAGLCPPIDKELCEALVDEYLSAERRYIQQDWEPAQLDGGQFSEISARILYSADSGIVNLSKDFGDCLRYVENDKVTHLVSPRHDAIHIARTLKTIYKFRSQRGAVHISPTYKPNQMDSKLVIECVRWVMNEMLRVFWSRDREQVAKAIREIIRFDVPAIGVFGEQILVQRTDLSAEEEILLLLHYAGEAGFSRNAIGKSARCAPSTVTTCIQKLSSASFRQIIKLADGNYRLTDLGSKRIREQFPEKLFL